MALTDHYSAWTRSECTLALPNPTYKYRIKTDLEWVFCPPELTILRSLINLQLDSFWAWRAHGISPIHVSNLSRNADKFQRLSITKNPTHAKPKRTQISRTNSQEIYSGSATASPPRNFKTFSLNVLHHHQQQVKIPTYYILSRILFFTSDSHVNPICQHIYIHIQFHFTQIHVKIL